MSPRRLTIVLAALAVGPLLALRTKPRAIASGYSPPSASISSSASAHAPHPPNPEANIPPQCYARVDKLHNGCWTCHTTGIGPNTLSDWDLQQQYSFSDFARENRWKNLLDPPPQLPLDDDAVLRAIRVDNYTALLRSGGVDLDLSKGFDEDGFARDGSLWRAVRYKPFPGAFFPTNGSAGDVYIRLPRAFATDEHGALSREVEKRNYDILEAAIAIDADIPATFVGGAKSIAVERQIFPVGVEFLHTVRYIDPDAPNLLAARMKEVRYSRKVHSLDTWARLRAYEKEADEKAEGKLPIYPGDTTVGLKNDFGWQLTGWIEGRDGRLRRQTEEEQRFCMGCHSGVGVTVDSTFSFARKVPGRDGFRVQDLRGMKDARQVGHADPEVLEYFARVGGGDDFRSNDEIAARFFPNGKLDPTLVSGRDLSELIAPSRARAIALNRGYLAVVNAQSFALGRAGNPVPLTHVLARIESDDTGIGEAAFRDGRLHLDWAK